MTRCAVVVPVRTGRVLLAGDAAHVHSPTGGQGLNLGRQDAFNLGWKLAAEVHGWAPAGLLDTYHAERHPVAARVLSSTRAQGVLMVPDDDVAALRDLVTELLRLADTNRHLAGLVSGLDIRYAVPVDPAGPPPHPLAGRRMPDLDLVVGAAPARFRDLTRDGTGVLLQFAPHAGTLDVAGYAGRVRHIHASPVTPTDLTAVLVRPDGYVAWAASAGATSPQPALLRWFGQPRPDNRTGSAEPGEVALVGDGVTAGIVRVGDTVRRPVGPFTRTVQAFLRHLHRRGFTAAPVPLGIDEQGREILSFVPGQVPREPRLTRARGAVALRCFH